jgi:hypothetical protein
MNWLTEYMEAIVAAYNVERNSIHENRFITLTRERNALAGALLHNLRNHFAQIAYCVTESDLLKPKTAPQVTSQQVLGLVVASLSFHGHQLKEEFLRAGFGEHTAESCLLKAAQAFAFVANKIREEGGCSGSYESYGADMAGPALIATAVHLTPSLEVLLFDNDNKAALDFSINITTDRLQPRP